MIYLCLSAPWRLSVAVQHLTSLRIKKREREFTYDGLKEAALFSGCQAPKKKLHCDVKPLLPDLNAVDQLEV